MNAYNWMGAVLFAGLYVTTFFVAGNAGMLVNGVGLTVVLSGTVGAMFLSYPAPDLLTALRVANNSYTAKLLTPERIIEMLQELAVRTRGKGVLALEDYQEQTTILFLRRALGLLIDGFSDRDLQDMLHAEMFHFRQRRLMHERLFRHAAKLAPAFGVAGSVIGLIAMLTGIDDPAVILSTVPIALTSTLYGIILANFFLTPIAENIHSRTERELLMQKLITDGVVSIRAEPNPMRLAARLESFLTPSERANENRSVEEMRERIRELRAEQAT